MSAIFVSIDIDMFSFFLRWSSPHSAFRSSSLAMDQDLYQLGKIENSLQRRKKYRVII